MSAILSAKDELRPCPAKNVDVPTFELIQIIKNWPKRP
jgi:hypothetical protein